MNWTRTIISGIVGGIVISIADFVQHGLILGSAYTKYPVFAQEPANPMWFTVIAILIGIFSAILFAKTRNSWADGAMGGLSFGFFLGMVYFFSNFYYPLVLEGFPYHLSWCWGGVGLVDAMLFGLTAGLIYKSN